MALLGLVHSVLNAFGASEYMEARGREPDFSGALLRFAAGWALWVLLAAPVVSASLWLWRRSRPWPLALALQLLLSVLVAATHAWGNELVQDALRPESFEDERWRGPSGERPPTREPAAGIDAVADGDERSDERSGERSGERDGERDGERSERWSSRWPRRGSSASSSLFSILWDPRRRLAGSLMQYWVVVAVGAGMVSTRRSRAEERRAAAAELNSTRARESLVKAQLEALRAQVHPHFLFNALHTVGGLIREQRGDEALTALSGLGDLLRAALRHGPDRQETSLGEELALVSEYLELEGLRFGDRLHHRIVRDADCERLAVPCLCLLPLVENAVRYAVEPRGDGGQLVVAVARGADDTLVLSVTDDGPGFPAEVLARGAGSSDDREQVGLSNTAQRLAMLYGPAGQLLLDNPPGGGARVTLRLPCKERRA